MCTKSCLHCSASDFMHAMFPMSLICCSKYIESTTLLRDSFYMDVRRHRWWTNAPIAARPALSSNGVRYTQDRISNLRHHYRVYSAVEIAPFVLCHEKRPGRAARKRPAAFIVTSRVALSVLQLVPISMERDTLPAKYPPPSAAAKRIKIPGRYRLIIREKLLPYGSQQPNSRRPSRCPFSWSTVYVLHYCNKHVWYQRLLR